MTYNIHITKTAERDLIAAIDYIEHTLHNPTAADHLLDETNRKINALAHYPERNRLINDTVLKSWGIRFMPIKNYLAFYRIDNTHQIVYIVRLLYQKRDWMSILKDGFSLE